MAFIVALVALAVQVYSTWYLAADDRYASFAATVSLFTAAMLLVVLSGDLLAVVGWEVMGWCSFLLIGHWSRATAHVARLGVPRDPARRHRLRPRCHRPGGRTTSLGAVVSHWVRAPGAGHRPSRAAPRVIVGVLGKSAQLPFQDWLADAMEGPTPASALIHAATMVAAGTVVLAGLFPLLAVSPAPAGCSASRCPSPCSSPPFSPSPRATSRGCSPGRPVSQVGVMLAALAAAPKAGPDAGLFHLLVARRLQGAPLPRRRVGRSSPRHRRAGPARQRRGRPAAAGLPPLGSALPGGVPLVVGGLSKEHVVSAAWEGAVHGGPGLVVLVALLLTAAVTGRVLHRAYLLLTAHVRPVRTAASRSRCRGCCGFSWS